MFAGVILAGISAAAVPCTTSSIALPVITPPITSTSRTTSTALPVITAPISSTSCTSAALPVTSSAIVCTTSTALPVITDDDAISTPCSTDSIMSSTTAPVTLDVTASMDNLAPTTPVVDVLPIGDLPLAPAGYGSSYSGSTALPDLISGSESTSYSIAAMLGAFFFL